MDEDGIRVPTTSAAAAAAAAAAPSIVAAPSPPPPPPPPPPAADPGAGRRKRFTVELRPGETTIVSWKKLLKSASATTYSAVPAAPTAAPGIDGHPGPSSTAQNLDGEVKDTVPPPNRFSAVIEKIERLYVGKQSSDEEELDDVPDDDQYDTEDSFIDDTELDEYFQVDKLETKHSGYFVNRGKLEQIEVRSSPNAEPRKRRRKDLTKGYSERENQSIPKESTNIGNVRMKAAARNAPLVGRKMLNPSEVLSLEDFYQEGKSKSTWNTTATSKRKTYDANISFENASMKLHNKDALSQQLDVKDVDKQKILVIASKEPVHKARGVGESSEDAYQVSKKKVASLQVEPQLKRSSNGDNDKHKGLLDMNTSGNVLAIEAASQSTTRLKEGAARPKGTTLERAIRDLEKIVRERRPADADVQEADNSSQAVKRRLPQEVKQKLAKVARLSASQCKITEDVIIDRLMGILGHIVQRKTLKRNMKEMVELGLSAKQQKADRFQQIMKEVNEMIKAHVSLIKPKVPESQDGSADDFQEAPRKYTMDKALEDKICDLYDLYVEGMDEDKGPQSRKLYVELAELWPNGYMDNLGIKDAIYRSKERKRALFRRHKAREEERLKRKRLLSAARLGEDNQNANVRSAQDKPDSANQFFTASEKHIPSQSVPSSSRTESASTLNDYGHHHNTKPYEKARVGSTSLLTEDGRNLKKKMKKRPESEHGDILVHSQKPLPSDSKERTKPSKLVNDNVITHQQKSSIPLPASMNNEPAS